ncbi:hypothetical protein KIW84_075790 [Lathyrus oleraceus]|uniref:Uncharacterized protein n=1 Tax=Pisum sativum TaxID=3888 RepID=A0A9D5A1H7_PEA|nr:hypothetical protein KIW84_075790 [Pisum sativum]
MGVISLSILSISPSDGQLSTGSNENPLYVGPQHELRVSISPTPNYEFLNNGSLSVCFANHMKVPKHNSVLPLPMNNPNARQNLAVKTLLEEFVRCSYYSLLGYLQNRNVHESSFIIDITSIMLNYVTVVTGTATRVNTEKIHTPQHLNAHESSTSVLSNALALPDLSSSRAAIPEDRGTTGAIRAISHHPYAKDILMFGVCLVPDVSTGAVAVAARRYDAVVTTLLCNSPASISNN